MGTVIGFSGILIVPITKPCEAATDMMPLLPVKSGHGNRHETLHTPRDTAEPSMLHVYIVDTRPVSKTLPF